jgi:hypothetical protein
VSIDSEKLKRNRLIDARRVLGGIGACAIFFMASPTSPASAAPDGPHQYPIAFTGEYGGVYPRENADLTSEKIGEVLAEGNIVSIACEYDGQEVSNSLGTSSQVWEKLDNGTSIPNAFVNTGVNGYTPGIDKCGSSDHETNEQELFIKYRVGELYGYELLSHYYDATGKPARIDWEFLKKSADFTAFLNKIEKDGVNSRVFEPNPASDPDILFAMGAFGVDRISPGCYKIVNTYDFKPDKLVNAAMYKKEYQDELDGKAKSFEMRASNCE